MGPSVCLFFIPGAGARAILAQPEPSARRGVKEFRKITHKQSGTTSQSDAVASSMHPLHGRRRLSFPPAFIHAQARAIGGASRRIAPGGCSTQRNDARGSVLMRLCQRPCGPDHLCQLRRCRLRGHWCHPSSCHQGSSFCLARLARGPGEAGEGADDADATVDASHVMASGKTAHVQTAKKAPPAARVLRMQRLKERGARPGALRLG